MVKISALLGHSLRENVLNQLTQVQLGIQTNDGFQFFQLWREVGLSDIVANEPYLFLLLWAWNWEGVILNQIFYAYLRILLDSFLELSINSSLHLNGLGTECEVRSWTSCHGRPELWDTSHQGHLLHLLLNYLWSLDLLDILLRGASFLEDSRGNV